MYFRFFLVIWTTYDEICIQFSRSTHSILSIIYKYLVNIPSFCSYLFWITYNNKKTKPILPITDIELKK